MEICTEIYNKITTNKLDSEKQDNKVVESAIATCNMGVKDCLSMCSFMLERRQTEKLTQYK